MRLVRILAATVLMGSLSAGAQAQIANSGFYLGAGGGGVKYNGFNELCRDITGVLPGIEVDAKCDTDETVTGFKAFGGWRWNQYVAMEGGFAGLGEGSGDTVIFGQDVNGSISADAFFVELLGSVPLGDKARAYGKLGLASLSVELTTDVFAVPLANAGLPTSTSFSRDFTEAVYGLGLEYGFTPRVSGRLEWERIDFEDGIDFFTLNIVYYPGQKQ